MNVDPMFVLTRPIRGVRFFATDGYLRRTTNVPLSTNVSICCWTRAVVPQPTAYHAYFTLNDTTSNSDAIGWDNVGQMGASDAGNFPSFPLENQWLFVAWSRSGNAAGNLNGYWSHGGEWVTKTNSGAGTVFTASRFDWGRSLFGGETFNGEIACMRVWKRILTPAQLRREMLSPFAVEMRDLDTDIPGYGWPNLAKGGQYTASTGAASNAGGIYVPPPAQQYPNIFKTSSTSNPVPVFITQYQQR